MRILITGARGQLGHDCLAVLGVKHTVAATDLPEFDVTSPAAIESVAGAFRPNLILNCAAYTAVDACETDPAGARRLNTEAPGYLAAYVARHGGHLMHLSTDYVFDGQRPPPQPYVETDEPHPLSVYGLTKLEGERAIQRTTPSHTILRTAWMYGAQGRNFPKTMLRLALRAPAKALRVVSDQYGSPTWSYRLARQIETLIEHGSQGLYHATAEGYGTWYDLACLFLNRMGIQHEVVPCATKEYPLPARRPGNSILANERLKAQGLHVMAAWAEDVGVFVRQYREALLREVAQT